MDSILLKARGKINLTLDVVGKRENGYHDLRMIMQTINLFDTLYIRKTKVPGIRLRANYSWLPTDEKNIVYRAVQVFFDQLGQDVGVSIELTKRIPVAAGLAGGSTDAAAALIGLNRLFNTKYDMQKLMEMGFKLGADVPFCILRGTVLAEGIGEELTPLPSMPYTHVVLVKPPISVSTAIVYKNLDINTISQRPDTEAVIQAIKDKDVHTIARNMVNVLEGVTIPMYPIIEDFKQDLMRHGAIGAMMSGSGSTVFGLFESKEKAYAAAGYFKLQRNVRDVYITTTFSKIQKGAHVNDRRYL